MGKRRKPRRVKIQSPGPLIKKRNGPFIYTIARKKRNRRELKLEIDLIPFAVMKKRSPRKRFINITFLGRFGKKTVGRTFVKGFHTPTPEAVKVSVKEMLDRIFSKALDYKANDKWKNYINVFMFEYY